MLNVLEKFITKALIKAAKAGDMTAAKLLLAFIGNAC